MHTVVQYKMCDYEEKQSDFYGTYSTCKNDSISIHKHFCHNVYCSQYTVCCQILCILARAGVPSMHLGMKNDNGVVV